MFESLVGQTLNRYKLVRLLGEDRLGALFKAHDPALDRDCAIETISPAIARRPGFAESFAEAARTAARLDHPNLVDVFDFGEDKSYHYIVMEYIPGDDLEHLLEDLQNSGRWILLGEAVQLVRQLALAMEYVRSQNAPQRNLRPSNVRIKPVESGGLPYFPVITSLGLARLFDGSMADNPAIAPAYLSPEAALGRATDARSDVYSLGVLLFELATGQLPFPIEDLDDAVRYHTRQPLPPPRSLRPDLPEALERIIVRAMEKNPAGRIPNPAVLAGELEAAVPAVQVIRTAPPALESAVSLLVPYRQSLAEDKPAGGAAQFERSIAPTQPYLEPTRSSTTGPQLEVVLSDGRPSAEPGGKASLSATVINRGAQAGQFRVTVEGLPSGWVAVHPAALGLAAGEQGQVSIVIQPPRATSTRPGRYPFSLRAASQDNPARFAEARANLSVGVFSRFTSQLYSQRLRTGETGRVAINNQGNAQEVFTLTFRDPEGNLAFTPPQAQLPLAEGQTGVVEFRAALRRPRWFGGDMAHPFYAETASAAGETQTSGGEIISSPPVPGWALGALAVLFLCFLGSLALAMGGTRLSSARGTATAVAQMTGAVNALTATADAGTATALALANANVATIQAATATADWLAGDDDNDGLTNQQELEVGTNPDRADTDGDGLSDGDEVQRGTNPLRTDTDGDGVSDGEEVARGTNPLNRDTDGDGIPDALDPNPLQTSTPVVNNAATAAVATAQAAAQAATQAAAAQRATQAAFATAIAQATGAAGQATAAAQATAIAQATILAQATAAQATANAAATLAAGGQAGTATALAGTATAAAIQTATAQAGAPVTPGTSIPVIYFYLTPNGTANDYRTLLQANGFQVDLMPQDGIPAVDFSRYRAILIGPDTGQNDIWGDSAGIWAQTLIDSGLPVIGLGQGGYAFFGKENLAIGNPNGAAGSGSNVIAVNPASPVWTTPNPIALPADQTVGLYADASPWVAINAQSPPGDIILVARQTDNPNLYPIIGQSQRFMLWGFANGPAGMTANGQHVFSNLLHSLTP